MVELTASSRRDLGGGISLASTTTAIGVSVGALILLVWLLSSGDYASEMFAGVALPGGLPDAFASGLTHKLLGLVA